MRPQKKGGQNNPKKGESFGKKLRGSWELIYVLSLLLLDNMIN